MKTIFPVLRKATFEDGDRLAQVYLSSRKECVACAPLARSDYEVQSWVKTTLLHTASVTVAMVENEIVGFIATTSDGACRWVEHLYVTPAMLGRGIGSQLLNQALATLKRPIRLYTFQDNEGARHFYEKHGFVALDYGDGSQNEEHCPDVLLEFRMSP